LLQHKTQKFSMPFDPPNNPRLLQTRPPPPVPRNCPQKKSIITTRGGRKAEGGGKHQAVNKTTAGTDQCEREREDDE